MKAIWKDDAMTFTGSTPYQIVSDGEVLFTGRVDEMPDGTCEVLANKMCQYYVHQNFPANSGVNVNSEACRVFAFKDLEGATLGTEEYICDWSYEDTVYEKNVLSKPVNGHLDPRMKLMWSAYSDENSLMAFGSDWEGQTGSTKYFIFVTGDNRVLDSGTTSTTVSWNTNYPSITWKLYSASGTTFVGSGTTTASSITVTFPEPTGDTGDFTFSVYSGSSESTFLDSIGWSVVETDRYEAQYFTIRAREDGTMFEFDLANAPNFSLNRTIETSTDGGQTWVQHDAWYQYYSSSQQRTNLPFVFTLNSGDTMMMRSNGAWYTGLYSFRITRHPEHGVGEDGYGIIIYPGSVDLEGNVMSLLYGSDFRNQNNQMIQSGLEQVFSNLHVVDAKNLVFPSTTANACYMQMFYGCNLMKVPPRLPATTLSNLCYQEMFMYSGIETAPELPATTLATQCYQNMFYGCSSLKTAPSVLPATAGFSRCYYYMFYGCISLRRTPDIYMRTIGVSEGMFKSCPIVSSITWFANGSQPYYSSKIFEVAGLGTFVKDSETPDSDVRYALNDWDNDWEIINV